MAEKNPYYIDREDTRRLSKEQIDCAKANNKFLLSVFTKLVMSEGKNATLAVPVGKRSQLLEGKLPYSDKETGISSNNLGQKVCFLLKALETNEADREAFANSYFSELITFLCKGTTDTEINTPERWTNYVPTSRCNSEVAKKDAFTAATIFYKNDYTMPVGLNLSKIIDCLVTSNGKGGFELNKTFGAFKNADMASKMTNAIKQQLFDFKNSTAFKTSFEKEDDGKYLG